MNCRAFLFIALALTGIAAADTAGPYDVNPPPVVAQEGYTLEKVTITDRAIPAYVLYADEFADQKKPAVILLHGGGIFDVRAKPGLIAKEEWFGWGGRGFDEATYRLANHGLIVVIIDMWWAGERYKPEYRDLVKENSFGALTRGYFESADDVTRIINYLETREDVDATRVGAAGWSGGGITSLIAACIEPRLTTVVAWVGCPDLVNMAYRKGFPPKYIERLLDEAPGLREKLQRYDPVNAYAEMAPKAVAIINNRKDPAIHYAFAQDLYDKLKPLYEKHPDRLKLELRDTPDETHTLDPQGYRDGCDWLAKFLAGTSATSDSSR